MMAIVSNHFICAEICWFKSDG